MKKEGEEEEEPVKDWAVWAPTELKVLKSDLATFKGETVSFFIDMALSTPPSLQSSA